MDSLNVWVTKLKPSWHTLEHIINNVSMRTDTYVCGCTWRFLYQISWHHHHILFDKWWLTGPSVVQHAGASTIVKHICHINWASIYIYPEENRLSHLTFNLPIRCKEAHITSLQEERCLRCSNSTSSSIDDTRTQLNNNTSITLQHTTFIKHIFWGNLNNTTILIQTMFRY